MPNVATNHQGSLPVRRRAKRSSGSCTGRNELQWLLDIVIQSTSRIREIILFNFLCYVFLFLCMFLSMYCVSVCCSVYCLCVKVYCTTATGCQQIYHTIIINNLLVWYVVNHTHHLHIKTNCSFGLFDCTDMSAFSDVMCVHRHTPCRYHHQ